MNTKKNPSFRQFRLSIKRVLLAAVIISGIASLFVFMPRNPTQQLSYSRPAPLATPSNADLTLAEQGVTRNSQWTPVSEVFNGVEMVLVPVGCLVMGNDSEADFWNDSSYVQNVPDGDEQCFDEPFWIDKTEVTQADFYRLGGEKADQSNFVGANRPVDDITWFEARDFCASRGGSLPTESEWEYVARGPEALYFPWGNEWESNNAVWNRNGSEGTANVGSILASASWVGALDMSGNVWEWTLSEYRNYPYDADDGRNNNLDSRDVRRVLRGGSWFALYDDPEDFRSATRFRDFPFFARLDYGFRCVLSYEYMF